MKYKIVIAGSSKYTVMMAETLHTDKRFELVATLSPIPKIIGHKKIISKNPLHSWSLKQNLKTFLIEKKIEKNLEQELLKIGTIDFLLVVDFGYLIPKWLLTLAKIAPLNIHPSLLPKWRGSSPGQFALLFQDLNEKGQESAVTLMIMDEGLDCGPIISQLPIKIEKEWTQNEYYQTAFELMSKKLASLIDDFAQNKIKSRIQPLKSPSMTARRLNKEDGFISWDVLRLLMNSSESKIDGAKIEQNNEDKLLDSLLSNQVFCKNKLDQIKLIVNAGKAFATWPGVWTIVETNKGPKRMKILSCYLANDRLVLEKVQIESKSACLFNECKNSII